MTLMLNHKYPNPNPELCAKCGGKCCKTCGCHLSPADAFTYCGGLDVESLRRLLKKGFVSIDYWEGDVGPYAVYDRVYYLRMRHKGAQICDPSWGGECILLTPTGCPVPFEQRPRGAQNLMPMPTRGVECTALYTKEQCATEWRTYWSVLDKLWKEFSNVDI